jgi:hypothetical protein
LPFFEPQSISTSTRIDPAQVDAVLRDSPKNVQAVIAAIGPPSARGIKSYATDAPMVLSNWSYTRVEMLGHEQRYTRLKEGEAEPQDSESYMVMNVTQSRLIIGHEKDGEIKEILWLKPTR